MSERTLLVRVDGGREVGLGHLMRCLAICRELEAAGVLTVLLMREKPELKELLGSESRTAVALPTDENEEYLAAVTRDIKRTLGGDAVLIDLPDDLSREAFACYAETGIPLALLDDHGPARDKANLVINAIAHPDHLARVKPREGYYVGPEYIILDPAFLETKPKERRESAGKILISMGGSDPHGITLKALQALIALPADVELHVLLGPAFNHKAELRRLVSRASRPVVVSENVEDVPRYLARFDLAVISFGMTAYGAAHLGLPAVLLGHNQPGADAAAVFSKLFGCARFLGRHDQISDSEILDAVQSLIRDPHLRSEFAGNGRAAVDGRGLERVKEMILGLVR